MPAPLLADLSRFEPLRPLLDREGIARVLPHRDAMALVDGI